ncbi:MAG TPA: hypothetical protein VF310_02680 [Vicinamibacteria bacterium]
MTSTTEAPDGRAEAAPADSALTLELSVAQAQALRSWLVKPAADGSSTMDDEVLKPVLVKLAHELDYREGVASVRQELEQAGLPTAALSDEQVAVLAGRISEAKLRRNGTEG